MGLTDDELNYREQTDLEPAQQAAADRLCDNLRMGFVKDWVLKANIDLYHTDAETNWAHIVRREHRYNVSYRAWGDGVFVGSFLQLLFSIKAKKVCWWPFLLTPLVATARTPGLFRNHNRRYFDMLNIGSEYELGAERNRILEECNRIAHRADF
jgi:hypothetical protein